MSEPIHSKGFTVPAALGEELVRDAAAMPPIWSAMTGALRDKLREDEIRDKIRRGDTPAIGETLFLADRERERAERTRKAEERAREARAAALTVSQLVEILQGLPQDAPVSVSEFWYDDAETVWADEDIADLRADGSVHVGG